MVCSHEPEPSWHQGKHLRFGDQLTLSKSGTYPILASWHLDKSFELSFYLFRNMSSEVTQLSVLRDGGHGDSVPSESPCLLNGHRETIIRCHDFIWLYSSFSPTAHPFSQYYPDNLLKCKHCPSEISLPHLSLHC